jgi:PadR family transcriptional regulator PadR
MGPEPERSMATQPQSDVLRGSIELLVLKTLSLQPMHGWGIGQRIQQISGGELEVNQGSLYPALQRLEQKGMITSDWRTSENNRRARYYEITPSGRRALGDEMESWRRFSAAIEVVLSTG